MKKIIIALLVVPVAAVAQTPAPPSTMDQLLSVHANIEASLAKQLDSANFRIRDLEAQVKKLQAEAAKKDQPKKDK